MEKKNTRIINHHYNLFVPKEFSHNEKHRIIFLLVTILILGFMFFICKDLELEKQIMNDEILKSEQEVPWGIESLNAPALWSDVTGKGVRVAIMDSGFNFEHPDFGKNIKEGYNAIDPGELPIDDYGHGTLVAGVIAAQNNSIGVVGIAPDVELYPIKVLNNHGEGDISDIADAIDWCINNKIQIINMSFAIPEDKPLLYSSILKATNAGIILVASASNTYGGEVGFPASYDEVISVTAVDKNYHIGKTAPRGKIDFSAPGVNILSTSYNGNYEEFSGTSLTAPHVTGLIALVLQRPTEFGLLKNEVNSQKAIYNILKNFSKDLGEKNKDNTFGEGFIYMEPR